MQTTVAVLCEINSYLSSNASRRANDQGNFSFGVHSCFALLFNPVSVARLYMLKYVLVAGTSSYFINLLVSRDVNIASTRISDRVGAVVASKSCNLGCRLNL